MNKFLLCFLTNSLLFLAMIGLSFGEESKSVIRIYNWSEFIDIDETFSEDLPIAERSPSLIAFAKKFNCKVEYYEYEDTSEMVKAVENLPGFYDIVIASHPEVKNLIRAGKALKLQKETLSNLENIYTEYSHSDFDVKGDYSVPFLVGTTGLLYRRDIVGYDITSWKAFFDPDEALKGKVNIFDDALLMFPMALQYIGADPNTQDPAIIKKAGRKIYNLNKNGFIASRTSDIGDVTSSMLAGEIAISPMFSGDALAAIDKAPQGQLKYVLPDEGAEFYVDSFVILKDSKNKELAHKFVNFMIEPKVHAANAIYLQYLCPNRGALTFIERDAPEQLLNPAIYPSDKTRSKLKSYSNYHSEVYRLWNKVFR